MAEALAAAFTDKLLTCSICLGEYEDPRVLPCYHTFCYGCIYDHATRTMTQDRIFLCPLCREEIQFPREGLVQLKKNFLIHTTKELLSQQPQHEVPSTNKETDVQEVTHGISQVMIKCEKHHANELKYYCEDDDTVVCGDCALTDHYRHGIVPVEKVADINRKKIETVLMKTVPKLNIFKEAVDKETANELEESQIIVASINKIKEQAQHIHKLVDQRERKLISEVNSASDIRKKQKEASKDTLQLHHASLQSACNFAQELITNGSASDIMIHTKLLTERLTGMEKMPVPIPDTPAQIFYKPGEISAAGLEAMLGQVTIQSPPPRLEANVEAKKRPAPNPPGQVTQNPPEFLWKARCVHSFTTKLKHVNRKNYPMFSNTISKYTYDMSDVTGLAIDEQHMFIVDTTTKVFTHDGQFKLDIKIKDPFDVAVSQTGQLYITSLGDKCVQVYSTRGQHLTTMGQYLLEMPHGITVNRHGHVMVCDRERKSIFTFHACSGQLLNTIPLSMCRYPRYITVNSVNDIIVVSDWDSSSVHVLSPAGGQLFQYGTYGSGYGQLDIPWGVCTDRYGHIFIADPKNNSIEALSPQGEFTSSITSEDDKWLMYPIALAINPSGQLVVAEAKGVVKTFVYL